MNYMKAGDFHIKGGDFHLKAGDFHMKCGDFQMKGGEAIALRLRFNWTSQATPRPHSDVPCFLIVSIYVMFYIFSPLSSL